MKILLLLTLPLLSFAHKKTSWKLDKKAFEYTKNRKSVYLKNIKSSLKRQQSFKKLKKSKLLSQIKAFKNDAIKEEFLKLNLEKFSGAREVVIPNSALPKREESFVIKERSTKQGRELARKYLAHEYSKLGYEVSLHNYKRNSTSS